MITIGSPIVDLEGRLQDNYQVSVDPSQTEVTRNIESDGRYTIIKLLPPLEAPILGLIPGQKQRFSGFIYHLPAGQDIYDNVIAREVLASIAPDIAAREKYVLQQDDLVESEENHQKRYVIALKHLTLPNTFLGVVRNETGFISDERKTILDSHQSPLTYFSEFSLLGALPLTDSSADLSDPKNRDLIRFAFDAILGRYLSFSHLEGREFELTTQNQTNLTYNGKVLSVPHPTLQAMEAANTFREEFQDYLNSQRDQLSNLLRKLRSSCTFVPVPIKATERSKRKIVDKLLCRRSNAQMIYDMLRNTIATLDIPEELQTINLE